MRKDTKDTKDTKDVPKNEATKRTKGGHRPALRATTDARPKAGVADRLSDLVVGHVVHPHFGVDNSLQAIDQADDVEVDQEPDW